MHLIVLPGKRAFNKEWAESIESEVIELFDSSHIHYYSHWKNDDNSDICFSKELEKLRRIVTDYPNDYMILAKSVGVLLTMMAIKEGILAPKQCMFIGTPILWARTYGMDVEWLIEQFEIPTLFIHQTNDPVISEKRLENLLRVSHIHNFRIKELPGEDHLYHDINQIKFALQEYLHHA